jgi:hypothetical protein
MNKKSLDNAVLRNDVGEHDQEYTATYRLQKFVDGQYRIRDNK